MVRHGCQDAEGVLGGPLRPLPRRPAVANAPAARFVYAVRCCRTRRQRRRPELGRLHKRLGEIPT